MNRIEYAYQLFDNYNKQDPRLVHWDQQDYPEEYFFALQLHRWVLKLSDSPGEWLLLASRCQHIGRWKIPRESYPAGKAGYLRWRTELAKFHASECAKLLQHAGYNETEIKQVQHILLKEDLKADESVQTMENALCLVFLEFQLEDFIRKHDEAKVIRIIQKSWNKMNETGRKAALSLNYSSTAKQIINTAPGKKVMKAAQA